MAVERPVDSSWERFLRSEEMKGRARARWNKEGGKRGPWVYIARFWPYAIGRGVYVTSDNSPDHYAWHDEVMNTPMSSNVAQTATYSVGEER